MTVVVDDVTSVESNQVTETQGVIEQDIQSIEAVESAKEDLSEPVESEYTPPEKYAGKSLEDVIEMHQNAEKAIGKQGQTVGDQRQMIDNLLEAQKATQTTQPTEEPESFEDKFYNDPAKAVNSAIENHPELIKAREDRAKQENQLSLNTLEKAYPEWEERVQDTNFQKWIGDSEIRTEMFRKADSDYRPDYAIELFQMYDAINMIDKTKEVQQQEASKREKALKQTSTETRSSGDSVGGKKIYRRADLINLQVSDPNRYAALADEIQSAYQEGRVK
jgi:hypothetical protein